MEFLNHIKSLLILDVKSLMGVLVWGDLALAALSFSYNKFHYSLDEKNEIVKFGLSKLLQAIAWLLLFLRGQIPDVLSIYIGNGMLYVGIYLESNIMLKMVEGVKKKWYRIQNVILVVVVVIFLLYETLDGKSNVRVTISSFGIFLFLLCPTLIYIFDKKSTPFKRYLGTNIFVFLLVLLVRGMQSLVFSELNLFSNNMFQSFTFIVLILLMFINGTGFLLLMYESTDKLMKAIADLDSLTQISNRRNFMSKASSYFERHRKAQKSVAILFIDIDRFKHINDTYGHLIGDEVLKNLAIIMTDCVRPIDLCCRYGGEEFVILLHESDESQAVMVANRIREKIETEIFDGGISVKYTISIGIFANIPDELVTLEKFIDFSDRAMYMAKKSGRDKVVCFDGIDTIS